MKDGYCMFRVSRDGASLYVRPMHVAAVRSGDDRHAFLELVSGTEYMIKGSVESIVVELEAAMDRENEHAS